MIDTFAALPVGTWLDILAAQEANPDPVDRQVATLSLLTGLPIKKILALPIAEYSTLARRAEFLATAPVRLPRAAKTYKVGEWTLRVQGDLREITAAQYIDFQTFAPQGDKALVELLSVVLIPDDAPGYNDGYDIAEVQTAIRADLFEQICRVNSQYGNLLEAPNEAGTQPAKEGGDGVPAGDTDGGAGEADGGADGFAGRWGWVAQVDRVSETLRCPWDDVWAMPVLEFFNVLAYRRDRDAREAEAIRNFQKTH